MTLLEALQNEIRGWLDAGRNRSLKGLARKAGLGYSTLRRIDSGEVQPQPHTALKIVRVTRLTAELVYGWMLEHVPDYAPYSEKSAELGVVYRSLDKSSAAHAGVFRELNFGPCEENELVSKFGPSARTAVSDLVMAKIAVKESSAVSLASSNVFVQNNDGFFKELSQQNIENFDSNLSGNVGFVEYFRTDDEGAKAMYYLIMEFEERLEKLRNEHNRDGNHKIGISGAMTMFSEGKK